MDPAPRVRAIATRIVIATGVLLAVLLVSCAVAVSVGPVRIGFGAIAGSLAHHLAGQVNSIPAETDMIIWDIRVPRVLLAVIVGMLLASAGAALQALLLNPLADPYTVGVSSGAALGASAAILLGLQGVLAGFGVPVAAFAVAILTMIIVYALARSGGRVSPHSFLLAGIVVGSFFWALITFVMTLARQDLATIIMWLLGSFAAPAPWAYVVMSLPFAVVGLVVLYAFARDLNVYSLGEETAAHLGVDTELLKMLLIAVASLITAAAVSVSGIIGFVGLMVPHMSRRIFGPDHRLLIPTSALTGAILLVLADVLARSVVSPAELPVGVITAMLGAPFFCYLLRRGTRN